MRKLLILCIALVIGAYGASLGVEKAEAATYVSMVYDGVYPTSNPANPNYGKIMAGWIKCDYDTAPVSGYYHYAYTIYLQDFDSYTLPSGYAYYNHLWAIKVMNVSKNPVEVVSSPTSPATWYFGQDPESTYYGWTGSGPAGYDYLYTEEVLNNMEVKSKFPPTYVNTAVWNGGTSTSPSKTIGPAPEPASLSLLGLSLLGLGGAMFRKKFKA